MPRQRAVIRWCAQRRIRGWTTRGHPGQNDAPSRESGTLSCRRECYRRRVDNSPMAEPLMSNATTAAAVVVERGAHRGRAVSVIGGCVAERAIGSDRRLSREQGVVVVGDLEVQGLAGLVGQRSGVVRVSASSGVACARPLSSGVLWRSLIAACPTATTIAFLLLLPVAAILATAATWRPKQRPADYPGKAQTQKLPATHRHSKYRIGSGCRFSCIRHRDSPCFARFVTILPARRRPLVPELPHDSQY